MGIWRQGIGSSERSLWYRISDGWRDLQRVIKSWQKFSCKHWILEGWPQLLGWLQSCFDSSLQIFCACKIYRPQYCVFHIEYVHVRLFCKVVYWGGGGPFALTITWDYFKSREGVLGLMSPIALCGTVICTQVFPVVKRRRGLGKGRTAEDYQLGSVNPKPVMY